MPGGAHLGPYICESPTGFANEVRVLAALPFVVLIITGRCTSAAAIGKFGKTKLTYTKSWRIHCTPGPHIGMPGPHTGMPAPHSETAGRDAEKKSMCAL